MYRISVSMVALSMLAGLNTQTTTSSPVPQQAASTEPVSPSDLLPSVTDAIVLHKVAPVYPPDAAKRGITGIVVLRATIRSDGHVGNLRVVSGPEPLTAAAVSAASQWIYQPYLVDGTPSAVDTTIQLKFAQAPSATPLLHVTEKQLHVLKKVTPVYPFDPIEGRISGDVDLDVVIAENGTVTSIHLISGQRLLAEAAAGAVHQWTYEPYLVDGKPTPVDTTITVHFRTSLRQLP